MTPVELLVEARKMISERSSWVKYAIACDREGDTVKVDDPDAVRWCALGAIFAAGGKHGAEDSVQRSAVDLVELAACDGELWSHYGVHTIYNSLSSYNDDLDRTHEDILALFDGVIAKEKEGPVDRGQGD